MRTAYFICVNFNNANYTRLYLESLLHRQEGQKGFNIVPIVVDNASTESERATLESFHQEFPEALFVFSETNVGYFRGLNLGIARINPTEDDYVIVGNNDLYFARGFTKTLMSKRYGDDVMVIAPDLITADGCHQNPHYLRPASVLSKLALELYFAHYWVSRLLINLGKLNRALRGTRNIRGPGVSGPIHMGVGACYILTSAYFKHFAKLDERVFLYGEEALLAEQLISVGGITYYDTDLIVDHAEHATVSKMPTRTGHELAKKSWQIGRKVT